MSFDDRQLSFQSSSINWRAPGPQTMQGNYGSKLTMVASQYPSALPSPSPSRQMSRLTVQPQTFNRLSSIQTGGGSSVALAGSRTFHLSETEVKHLLSQGAQILSERYEEQRVRVPKRIVREEVFEKVIRIPEVKIEEEIVEEEQVIQERIIEVAKPVIQEKIVEVVEYEYRDKIIEVPEIVVQERIHQIPKIDIVERVHEVPKIIRQEKIVEIPEVHYRDVPVVRRVEVPEVREETVYKERQIPQYVDKPIPQVFEIPRPYEVPVNVPETYAVDAIYRYEIPRLEAVKRQAHYPVYIPKFVEVPIPRSFVDDNTIEQINRIQAQVSQVTQSSVPLSLAGIESLAANLKSQQTLTSIIQPIHNNGFNVMLQKFNQGKLQVVQGNPDPFTSRKELQQMYDDQQLVKDRGGRRSHKKLKSRRKHVAMAAEKKSALGKYGCGPIQMEWMTPRQEKYSDRPSKGVCGVSKTAPTGLRRYSIGSDSSSSYCSSCSDCNATTTSPYTSFF